MTSMHELTNASRGRKARRRVGRGRGSGMGKTCGRGEKGMGSRAGATKRLGYEGGQMRLFMKIPSRGFNNARFRKKLDSVNLIQIDRVYQDGETVNLETLREKGLLSGPSHGVKILGTGVLTKKVKIEAAAFSASAKEHLEQAKIKYTVT